MTFEKLQQIIEENNIPHDVQLQSDSGWECCETEMDGVYYDAEENRLIFTQTGDVSDEWFCKNGVYILNGRNKKCQGCKHLSKVYCELKRINDQVTFDSSYVGFEDTSNCKDFEEINKNKLSVSTEVK